MRADIATDKVWSKIGQRTKKLFSQYRQRPNTVASKALGLAGGKKDDDIEVPPVAEDDIQRHFTDQLRDVEARRVVAQAREQAALEALTKPNPSLRYQEPLYLNRKGHQPAFKSVTRERRYN